MCGMIEGEVGKPRIQAREPELKFSANAVCC